MDRARPAPDRFIPGYTPSMVVEIPPYRLPHFKAQLKKMGMRVRHIIFDAIQYILGGILFMNLLSISGASDFVGLILAPVVEGLFGLPGESVTTFLIGFLRKDVAVAMLLPLNLSARQFVIGATVLAAYFPCAATFTVMLKELGLKDMTASAAIMLLSAGSAGVLLNLLLERVLPPLYLSAGLVGAGIILALLAGGTSSRREISAVQNDSVRRWIELGKKGHDLNVCKRKLRPGRQRW